MSHSDAEIREGVVLENKIEPHIAYNPFNYVEPCEPDCTPERHAYHQGQWEMAQRICESFGVLPNPVDGHDIPINATKAILALIEEQTRLARKEGWIDGYHTGCDKSVESRHQKHNQRCKKEGK